MRRAEFEEKQYRLLVDLTEQATSDFAKNCRKTWQRGAEKCRVVQERFKLLMHQKAAERKKVIDGYRVPGTETQNGDRYVADFSRSPSNRGGALLNSSMGRKIERVATLPC